MIKQSSLIITSLLFIIIPISFGQNDACKSGQTDCQPSKVLSFDESKLYFITNQKGYICNDNWSFLQGDPTKLQNQCLFKFKHIEHNYYSIQVFATEAYIGIGQKSLEDNKDLERFSLPIDTYMQFKFIHIRDGWYEVVVRRTSKIWSFSNDYSNGQRLFQTSGRTQGINQLFRVEQYYD